MTCPHIVTALKELPHPTELWSRRGGFVAEIMYLDLAGLSLLTPLRFPLPVVPLAPVKLLSGSFDPAAYAECRIEGFGPGVERMEDNNGLFPKIRDVDPRDVLFSLPTQIFERVGPALDKLLLATFGKSRISVPIEILKGDSGAPLSCTGRSSVW